MEATSLRFDFRRGFFGRRHRRVKWATDRKASCGEDMGIDHSGPDILVAEQFLDGTNVVPLFQEVGGEGMSERMAACVFWNSRAADCSLDRALQDAFVDMVSVFVGGGRFDAPAGRGEEVLPAGLF